jgi:hypothetical protein
MLMDDPDFTNSEVDVPIAEGIMVRLNRFRNGVYYGYHRLFSTDEELSSLMSAFDWAKNRGPVLVKKCNLLSV